MHCTSTAQNTKIIGLALQCLSRIGKYVYLEVASSGLRLRTLNDSKSAFAAFYFQREFFTEYHFEKSDLSKKCQFQVKACQNVFRSLKYVETMTISFDVINGDHVLVFEAKCKHDITKTYRVIYEDTQILEAVFDKNEAMNSLGAKPSAFARIFDALPRVEEITWTVGQTELNIKSYCAENTSSLAETAHGMHTALSVPLHEFERCEISTWDCGITFSVKVIRALISFAEAREVAFPEIVLYTRTPGAPILLSTNGSSFTPFHGEVILSTLAQSTHSNCDTVDTSSTPTSPHKKQKKM